jgi:predicted RND superfamily exporter protein
MRIDEAKHSIDGFGARWAGWTLRWRWPILTLSALVALGAGAGASQLRIASDYRVFFSEDNPDLLAFEAMQKIYTKNDNVLFVVEPASGDAFSHDALAALEDLTDGAWQIPYAIRVDGITNFQHSEAEGDDLLVGDLVRAAESLDEAGRAKVRRVALAEPLVKNRIVSERGDVAGVNVTLQLPDESTEALPPVVAAARELAQRIEAEHADVTIRLTGIAMLNNAFDEESRKDMATLMPLMYLGIIALIYLLLRSGSATFSTVLVIGMSTATAMGLAGWLGIPITPPSSTAPVMIMTLAVADSIHILTTTLHSMRAGRGKRDALVESLRVNLLPVFLTSLTTAIGFLSMNLSDSPPFRDLGNMTAMGVIAAFFFSALTLPALVSLLPLKARATRGLSTAWTDRFAGFVTRHRRPLLAASALTTLALAAVVPANELNDDFVDYFDNSVVFRQHTDFSTQRLTGLYQLEFDLRASESGGISEPEYLRTVGEFADWYAEQPYVRHVLSLTDVFKRLNRNMHGDDPAEYRLPERRDLAAQYLLLFEMSLPYGLDLNNQINVDKSGTRFIVTLDDISTREIRELAASGEAWLAANAPPEMRTKASGPSVMFAHLSKRNIEGMLLASLVALVLVSITLVFAFRSLKFGLLSLIPNVAPAALAFGAWGLSVGRINIALSAVVAMTLGIVVDDTVHFLSKYLRARREKNADGAEAVRYAFNTVGPALLFTSIILAGGFLVLAGSSFDLNAGMGKLTAMTIVFALVTDFLLLPSLLLSVAQRAGSKTIQEDKAMTFNRPIQTIAQVQVAEVPAERTSKNAVRWITALALVAILALTAGALTAQEARGPAAGEENGSKVEETWMFPVDATPEEQGLAIATEADRRDTGFGDFVAELSMILRNRHGEESSREMRTRTLEVEGDGDKSLVIFDRPGDVAGTAFLSWSHTTGSDDQWIYLPALKRVKRIATNNKSGPFMGSEFSYEDISSQEVEEYSYRYLRDEMLDGIATYVVEQDPVDENSGYSKVIVWRDKQHFRTLKIEFYDRKGDPLKTLVYEGYQQYLGQYWRADRMLMVNHQTGKSTELAWHEYEFATGLRDRDFNQNGLKRAR